MQPQTDSDYKKIFTELIRKQMIILGPDITLSKAKNVPGIQVSEQGEVTNIDGDPQALLQLLINQFVELSGAIVKKTMESILNTYPGMAAMAVGAVAPVASPVTPVASPISAPPLTSMTGSNAFSDVPAQTTQVNTQNSDVSDQFPKAEMDTINKALSELGSANFSANSDSPLENKNNNMQESKSN